MTASMRSSNVSVLTSSSPGPDHGSGADGGPSKVPSVDARNNMDRSGISANSRGRDMTKKLTCSVAAALVLAGGASAATKPAGFYWTTARAAAAFKTDVQKQQAQILNGHTVTATCKGMAVDADSATPQIDTLKVNGTIRYRFFNCVASSPCFAAPWESRVNTLSARKPNAKMDPLRIRLVAATTAPVGVAC